MDKIEYLKKTIKVVKDYPKKGVNFKDVSSLLKDPEAFNYAIDLMAEKIDNLDYNALAGQDVPALFGITMSYKLKKPFIMMNKKGTLPGQIIQKVFNTEYSVDEIEINPELVNPGQKVIIVGYLIATSGTAKAKAELVEKAGGEVIGFLYLIKQKNFEFTLNKPLYSILEYDD